MKLLSRSAAPRSFTFVEVMVALVILSILVTVAIPTYRNIVEDTRSELCGTHLEALKSAFDIYIGEHNVVPGTLSELSPAAVDKAFAKALRTKGWNVRLASFIDSRTAGSYAFASLIEELGKGNAQILMCPSNLKPSTTHSYGINEVVAGKTKEEYLALPANTVIIADSNRVTFTAGENVQRHKHFKGLRTVTFANQVTKGNWVRKEGAQSECGECKALEQTSHSRQQPEAAVTRKIIHCWRQCL